MKDDSVDSAAGPLLALAGMMFLAVLVAALWLGRVLIAFAARALVRFAEDVPALQPTLEMLGPDGSLRLAGALAGSVLALLLLALSPLLGVYPPAVTVLLAPPIGAVAGVVAVSGDQDDPWAARRSGSFVDDWKAGGRG